MLVNSLKPSTTKDVYGMDSAMLKHLKDVLAPPITQIINLSISQGVFPKVWKTAVVSPIFKSGDSQAICNYRPISILPVVSKVAEKWVAEQLISHLNNSPISLHPMQFGFRANHFTDTANCLLIEKVKSMMDKGGTVGAVFLDLRKAFDPVNHRVLIAKLSSFNFSNNALKWSESYLMNRIQCVNVRNQKSSALDTLTGVPQGSILGPLLFSLYINDLPSVCSDVEIQLYSDDAVIFTHGSNKLQAAATLTNALNRISTWLIQSCLQLNTSKTVCMFFSKKQCSTPDPAIMLSGVKLQVVSEFKYLGLLIDSQLSFKSHVKKEGHRVKFNLSNFRFIRNSMTTDAAKIYMHAMIMSHFTYCLTSFAQANKTALKPLETLYKRTQKVLDRKSNTYHHCLILRKYKLLSWDNLIKYANLCLIF